MKSFPFLPLVFFLTFLEITTCQDVDKRLERFLNRSLTNFPAWLKQNDFVPDPLDSYRDGKFTLTSVGGADQPHYDIAGEFTNRYYHGGDKNIRFLNIKSNLSSLSFKFDMAFGDGENDSVEGHYSLDGYLYGMVPVHGNGSFSRTNQLQSPLHSVQQCHMFVTDEGSFRISGCSGTTSLPKFANLTLKGFRADGEEQDIKSIVEAWYNVQIMDNPQTSWYWLLFMNEIFKVTPIDKIIGVKLPPMVAPLTKGSGDTPIYIRKPYFDPETKQWAHRTSITL